MKIDRRRVNCMTQHVSQLLGILYLYSHIDQSCKSTQGKLISKDIQFTITPNIGQKQSKTKQNKFWQIEEQQPPPVSVCLPPSCLLIVIVPAAVVVMMLLLVFLLLIVVIIIIIIRVVISLPTQTLLDETRSKNYPLCSVGHLNTT